MSKIYRKHISSLNTDAHNVRTHSEKNIGAIVKSLERFGQQKPIVVDSSNVVRAGNGTLEAAKVLGWKKIDVVVSDLTSEELTAYAIADNRTAELAEWNDDGLSAQLADMDDELLKIVWDDYEFPKDPSSSEGEDDIPEVPQNVCGVERGDIWLLGTYLECDGCGHRADYVKDQEDTNCPKCA